LFSSACVQRSMNIILQRVLTIIQLFNQFKKTTTLFMLLFLIKLCSCGNHSIWFVCEQCCITLFYYLVIHINEWYNVNLLAHAAWFSHKHVSYEIRIVYFRQIRPHDNVIIRNLENSLHYNRNIVTYSR